MDYDLQHYDTIILKVRNSKIEEIRPVTRSSIRAINQGLTYLLKCHIVISHMVCSDYVKNAISLGVRVVREY